MAAPPISKGAEGVRWNLDALFTSTTDPKIAKTWSDALGKADAFAADYRGKIESAGLSASAFAACMQRYESIVNEATKPVHYANLLFAADTSDPALGAFLQSQNESFSEFRVKLVFFDLELQDAPDDWVDSMLAQPELANYTHFVQTARQFKPHKLSETEEVLLEETANTGCRAWQRLHDELTSNQEFEFADPESGESTLLSQEAVLDKLRDPDRAVRQAAADALSSGLAVIQRPLVFLYNTLLADKKLEDRLRKFEHPESSRHLANELDKETVDTVMQLCKDRSDVVARYYGLKREILGLPELTHIDRYAPLFEAKQTKTWEEAKSIVLDSFASFSAEMEAAARKFFDHDWIDAEHRQGKSGGAFCSPNTPDTHPVLLQTYLGDLSDVMTLAHEMGHGVHAYFSREQTPLNYNGTLPLAELASIFCEMVTFERLVAGADARDKLALYAEKIEGIFATVHRQSAMFRFEQRCHQARRETGELAPADFGQIWQEEMQSMFGESIKLGEQHRAWWMYVSHFVFTPFYVYAYSFGELLTLSLYQKSKLAGPEFAQRYVAVLRLGGKETPHELMARLGVDLRSKAFWEGGFAVIDAMVAEFERLWQEVKGS